jgi:hypothetical protein
MDSISKKSGRLYTGKLGDLMHRIGIAVPSDEYVAPEKTKKSGKKAPAKRGKGKTSKK